MNSEFGMYQGYNVESKSMEMSSQTTTPDTVMDGGYGNAMSGIVCPPIYECPRERCIHRHFVHEVPHVCPINTKVINHHIYRHTYSPCYTCCEENTVCNEQCGSCCNFR